MQIKCPGCKQNNTTIPQALLGRIYVCAHCHRILRLDFGSPPPLQGRPLAVSAGDACDRGNGKSHEQI